MQSVRNISKTCIQFAITMTTILCCSGCPKFYMDPGTTYGEIKVGTPRVTTRERLVNDRLEEEVWLKRQLAEADNQDFTGVQGVSDVRYLSGMAAQAGVSVDPGQMRIYHAQQKQQMEELERKSALDSMDYQIMYEKKKNELAAVTSNPTISSSTLNYNLTTTATNSLSTPSVSETQKALDSSLDKLNRSMPSFTNITTTNAKASPVDLFRDKLAYREEIRNEILQNALDDSHDLHGNTLYRLNFDTTVTPADDTSAWAVINVKITPPKNPEPTPVHFARMVNVKIAETSRKVADAIRQTDACKPIKTIQSEDLKTAARDELAKKLTTCLQDDDLYNILGYFPLIVNKTTAPTEHADKSSYFVMLEESKTKQNQVSDVAQALLRYGKKECKTGQCSLTVIVANFVAEFLIKLQLNNPSDLNYAFDDSDSDFLCGGKSCANDSGRLKGFKYYPDKYRILPTDDAVAADTIFIQLYGLPESERDRLNNATTKENEKRKIRRQHIAFLGATPKESVQRISDVVARRSANEAALALKAFTGTTSLDAMLSYFNQTDGMFEALRRQPLVVGYTDNGSFGWLIGPKYRIEHNYNSMSKPKVGYRQVTMQNAVSGTISVPVFWKSVNVKIEKYWQPENGGPKIFPDFSKKAPMNEAGMESDDHEANNPVDGVAASSFPVNLPARLLLAYDPLESELDGRQPLLADEHLSLLKVFEGDAASLTILGENLWRNTTVILGAQLSDKITVLPNMKGIVATFNKVHSPGIMKDNEEIPTVDLLVATAEGSKKIGRVKIIKAPERKVDDAKWEIVGNHYIHPESNFILKPDQTSIAGYSKIELELLTISKPIEIVGSSLTTDNAISFDSANCIVAIPKEFTGKGLTNNVEYMTRIKVYKTPKDANPSQQVLGNVVYYANLDSSKVESKIGQSKKDITLTFPKKYEKAYPELGNRRTINITVKYKDGQDQDRTNSDLKCTIKSNNCTVTVEQPIKSINEIVIEDGSAKYPKVK